MLRVLFIGRTCRAAARWGGGIYRSAQQIPSALRAAGARVDIANIKIPLEDLPKGTDLVWVYGDLDTLDSILGACARRGVPVLVNSTYDGTVGRAQWLAGAIAEWNRANPSGVFAAVFSPLVPTDPELAAVRDRLLCVPKVVRSGPPGAPFAQRQGVCLGELSKLKNAKLTSGFDFHRVVDKLRPKVPNLLVYARYDTEGAPPGVTVLPLMADFLDWLGTVRVLTHMTVRETFAMVPAEAQSVGTPVVYRSMPQSLSCYLGMSAAVAETEDQLVHAVQRLYFDQDLWEGMSKLGLSNASAVGPEVQGPAVLLALEKLLG